MKNKPKTIFLVCGEGIDKDTDFKEIEDEVCWCTDKAFKDDIEYIRKDLYDELKRKYALLKEYSKHPQYGCQMGGESL